MKRWYDDSGWPMVSGEDFRALLGLIALLAIFLGVCAVDPS